MSLAEHGTNIKSDRAIAHAATTSGASNLIHLVQPVDELVAEALAGPFHPGWARVVPGSFQGIGSEHTGIPVAHALLALGFVDDVEAEASGAQEGANTAAQTALRDFFPKLTIEILFQLFLEILSFKGNRHLVMGDLLNF